MLQNKIWRLDTTKIINLFSPNFVFSVKYEKLRCATRFFWLQKLNARGFLALRKVKCAWFLFGKLELLFGKLLKR